MGLIQYLFPRNRPVEGQAPSRRESIASQGGLLGLLFPRRSLAEGVLPPNDPPGGEQVKSQTSVEEVYGLPEAMPDSNAGQGPAAGVPEPAADQAGPQALAAEGAVPLVAGASSEVSPSPASPPTSPPAPSPEPRPEARASGSPEQLDSPIRDLFTENAAVDPQFETLLARVEKLDANSLAKDLREFAKSIGADTGTREPEG